CVATAMAQVMKKWNHPATGVGSHSYTASGYGNQSANFAATTYNWAGMPNSISTVNNNVATLIYHCGVAVDMMYSANSSGAYTEDARSALVNNFRYNNAAQYKQASSYPIATWASMLRNDLDLGHPIYYEGQGPESGHAFVLDGYQGTNSFHFNWGWSGYYDGYFYLTNLNPGSHTFTSYQGAILNVYPVVLANLTGTVSSGGTGLAGATVSVAGTSFSTTTNTSGGYTIAAIPAGTYQVTASKTGYDSAAQSVTLVSGQTSTLNFTLAESSALYPPSNFHANTIGNDVHLAWDAPVPPSAGEWITWCHPEDMDNAIGTNSPAIFDVAHRYDSADLTPYQGSTLTHLSFVPSEANCVYTLKVWTGGTATTPGSMVHSQVAIAPTINTWNDVVLTTPIPIPATGNLWFGYEVNTQSGYPAGCDNGPMVPGKGNFINFNGWTTLNQLGDTFVYNWLIQGYVDHDRAMVQMPEPIYEATGVFQSGQLALLTNPHASLVSAKSRTREQIGYKLYRGGNLIATINNPATLTYIDADLAFGSYSYTLSAYYNNGESSVAGPLEVVLEGLAAPADLAATVDGNDVNLSWVNPMPPQTGEWISWSDNSALGNSIGTDAPVIFDVAHRYEASDLIQYVGGVLTQVKFVPMYANCTYTVKVWTGGTSTEPGTLVYSQVVNSPSIEAWATAVLTTPIPIAVGTQYWIGYNVNTQGGHPAGCDNGPMVAGKGNLINFDNTWSTIDQLTVPPLQYNWLIQGFVAQGRSLKAIELPAIVEAPLPAYTGQLTSKFTALSRDLTRAVLLGYKVYRNGTALATINDPAVITYTDNDLPNGNYVYGVSAVYNTGESAIVTINVNIDLQLAPAILEDSFEYYPDFATAFGNWTLLDQDNSGTYGFTDVDFPGMGSPMSYLIFNPSQTVPPLTDVLPYEGNKMAACFAALTFPNRDWLITERITLGTNSTLRFQARSHTAQYGLEHFKVGVSTMPIAIIQGFQFISGPSEIEAPANWTEYTYDLCAYDELDVFIAIRCSSYDAFVFYVDNFAVHSQGVVPQQDPFGNPVLMPTSMSVVANVTINMHQASAGDVLAAFVNVNGIPELRGKQTVQDVDGIAGCILQVYTETNGEELRFKVWDSSTNQVLNSPTTLNTEVNGTVGEWPNSFFVIYASTGVTQSIPLLSGWNLVSLNVSPSDHTLPTLLAPISSQIQQVKGTEGIYIPGNPYSTLSALTDGKAYNIQVNSNATWSITGDPLLVNASLALSEGWNLTAYLPQNPMAVATAMQSISNWLQQVKGSDGVY
ncbi:MAG: C10 family peptidase, partial [Candidatus Cloacimonetes bacterium]|nr:C10 family peptidase [Candidatus Cloacimonadota bacterium]MCK9185598.1 C10 family peptidase [Candidatus Cloacimonadota bacterium]